MARRVSEVLERAPWQTYRTMSRLVWCLGEILEHLRAFAATQPAE